MATINRENIGKLNDRISIKVNQEDYIPGFNKVLKQYSKEANLPGFRKGMVPSGLIKKMHGQALFTQEVVKSVEQQLTDYLKKESLEIFGNPLPVDDNSPDLDVNNPGEYTFDFEVGIKPDFEITPLKNDFHFTRYKIKPGKEKIDEEVDRLQKRRGESKEKEKISSDEDILYLQFAPSDEEGQLQAEGETKEEQLRLSFFAPDLRKQLMGKGKGDTFHTKLNDAFEDKELNWILNDWKLEKEAGEQYFQLTINKVEEIIPRELNEEFFKEIYPGKEIKTEEELRAEIEKEIQAYLDQEATNRLDQEIFEKLVHDTPIELPEEFLKKWMKQEEGKPKTDEEVEEGYSNFDHQLRWNLISAKLLKDLDISAAPEEIEERIRQRVLNYFSQSLPSGGDLSWTNDFVNKMMQDEKTVRDTYQEVLTDKLFKQLREKAEIEEKEVTEEEFSQLPHNHHHHEH